MGQYYKPCVLKKNWKIAKNPVKTYVYSWDFNNGLKLMEHSYVGNSFVKAVVRLLGGKYYGYPFVWCGDYADAVKCYGGKEVDIYDSADETSKEPVVEELKTDFDKGRIKSNTEFHYIVNKTKKEFVRIPDYDEEKWQVHPLPLLTCNSNGRGGGDYRLDEDGYNYELDKRIGSWAYDRIGATDNANDIVGYKEIDGYFKEY